MKIYLTIIILLLIATLSGADTACWNKVYDLIAKPENPVIINIDFERSLSPLFDLELSKEYDANFPLKVLSVELDGISVKPFASILRNYEAGEERVQVRFRPSKPLKPGYHLLMVKGGTSFEKKTMALIKKIDPSMNVFEATGRKEISDIFKKMLEERVNKRTLDCNFSLYVKSKKGTSFAEQRVEGKLEITGEDKIDFTFASAPNVKIKGKELKGTGLNNFIARERKGSRLLLWPLHLAYYLPYEDLANYYNWYLYKRVNDRAWMFGTLLRKDIYLPQFVELVVDEGRRAPLEVRTFVYNKEHAFAEARIEYDKIGLPTRQVLERCLPSGEQEVSVLDLKNVEVNRREPRQRWFLL